MPLQDGATPLHVAAELGHELPVEARPLLGPPPPMCVLCWGPARGRNKTKQVLLQYGAKPGARGLFGATPLHCAAAGGHLEAARLLLEAGADPNAADDDGSRWRDWPSTAGACCSLLSTALALS